MTEITLKAPTGAGISGTLETIGGTCPVSFYCAANGSDVTHESTGGTNIDWDGQRTREIVGSAIFTDDESECWLAHHLIPDGPDDEEALPDEIIRLMRAEFCIGEQLEAARELKIEIGGNATTSAIAEQAAWIFDSLDRQYRVAKDIVLATLAEHRAPSQPTLPPPATGQARTWQFDAFDDEGSIFSDDVVAASREEAELAACAMINEAWHKDYKSWGDLNGDITGELLEFDGLAPTRADSVKMAALLAEIAATPQNALTVADGGWNALEALTAFAERARALTPTAPQEN